MKSNLSNYVVVAILVWAISFISLARVYAGTINVDINDQFCLSSSNQSAPYTVVYCNIQDAMDDSVPGDIVMVADGTYSGAGNKNLDFNGKAITVQSENGPESVIIDCGNNGRGFYFHNGEGEDSIVSGFTITNGRMTRAGGISIENSSPTVRNCIISGNYAYDANSGGIGIFENSSPTILDCKITGNSASMWGGGIGSFDSSPTIKNCIISNNESEQWWGGGMVSYYSSPSIINSIISDNLTYGDNEGGGIYLNHSSAVITNCTFSRNIAGKFSLTPGEGGAVYSSYESEALITNSIFWSNSPDEIAVYYLSNADVSYSIIEEGWAGESNLELNPAFMDQVNNDYRLKVYSPAIGAGSSTGAPDTDIVGVPRPNPIGSSPDIGAHENTLGLPVDSEQWVMDLDNGQGSSELTLYEKIDQSVSADGSWDYIFQELTVSGGYVDALVTIDGRTISIIASGTAIDQFQNTSAYTLSITGNVMNGQGIGTFTLSFQNVSWPDTLSGNWEGTRIRGGGITPVISDINDDGVADILDAIIALKVAAGMSSSEIRLDYITAGVDASGDNKVGTEEAINALMESAGL